MALPSCCLSSFFNSPGYWWAEDLDSSEEAKDRTWWATKGHTKRRQLIFRRLGNQIKSIVDLFLFFSID
jgi:hypothetical protein